MARQLQTQGLQHDRPIDRVRWHQDILPDHMVIRRPILRKRIRAITRRCNVIRQGIKPNVGHEIRIEG